MKREDIMDWKLTPDERRRWISHIRAEAEKTPDVTLTIPGGSVKQAIEGLATACDALREEWDAHKSGRWVLRHMLTAILDAVEFPK